MKPQDCPDKKTTEYTVRYDPYREDTEELSTTDKHG